MTSGAVALTGMGYVGLVTAACLAETGHAVLGLDLDAARVRLLQDGRPPFHEPGLQPLLARHLASGRLRFTADPAEAAAFGDFQLIAVGTPAAADGSADIGGVIAAARQIGQFRDTPCTVAIKSTVPVGTCARVRQLLAAEWQRRGLALPAPQVASNPEFLRQGSAVQDFLRPDRIVLGCDDDASARALQALYAPLLRDGDAALLVMDSASAELAKYAANAMLATRLSFINEMALLADRLGADVESVRRAIGADPRIGGAYLQPGCGYGGSCLPKDVLALRRTAEAAGLPLRVLDGVAQANDAQRRVLVQRLAERFGDDLQGRRIALWGLAYRPHTDDLREAPSLTVIEELLARGAEVVAHDPAAMPGAQALLGERPGLRFADSAAQAVRGADALLIVTEWPLYAAFDLHALRSSMRTAVVLDGRHALPAQAALEAGIDYLALGRAAATAAPADAPPWPVPLPAPSPTPLAQAIG